MKIAIVGAGKIAKEHLTALVELKANLIGIASRSGTGLSELADQYQIESTWTCWRSMLEQTKPDAVFILVSCDQIYAIAKEVLQKNISVFIEKPPGMTVEQCTELESIAQKNNVLNMVGLNRRFYSVLNQTLEFCMLRGGINGFHLNHVESISKIRLRARQSSEVLNSWIYANGLHMVDLYRFVGGSPILENNILSVSKSEPNGDCFSMQTLFENGVIGSYSSFWDTASDNNIEIFGNGFSVKINLGVGGTALAKFKSGETVNISPNKNDVKFKPGFLSQTQCFLNAIKHKNKLAFPAADLSEALKSMTLVQNLVSHIRH